MANDIVRQNTTELSLAQHSAVAALATGSNVTDTARKVGVDRTTVHRWLSDDPHFAAALNRAKLDALAAIRAEVRVGAAEAVVVVRKIMLDRMSGPSVRLRAALALLDRVGAATPELIGPTDPDEIESLNSKNEFTKLLGRFNSRR